MAEVAERVHSMPKAWTESPAWHDESWTAREAEHHQLWPKAPRIAVGVDATYLF